MRTYSGIVLGLLLEVAAVAGTVAWRRRAGRRRDRFAEARHLTAVLEIEDADAPLSSGDRVLPVEVLRTLREDPLLGLADVHVVRHVQRTTGEHTPLGTSYQTLVETLIRRGGVPVMRWTWLELRLELAGSRNRAWAARAAGPIEARGGGRLGAARTLDKAVGSAAAELGAAGFLATRLDAAETMDGLEISESPEMPVTPTNVPLPTQLNRLANALPSKKRSSAAVRARLGIAAEIPQPAQTAQATQTTQTVQTARAVPGTSSRGASTSTIIRPAIADPASIVPTITVPAAGVLLGLDPARQPVVLTLFRRRPLAVHLVGGLHLAQVLVLRAAAVGARVIIETARATAWDPVVLHSGLDSSRLALQNVGRVAGNPGWTRPAPTAPLLVVRDCGARPPYASVPLGPWVAVITLLPYLDPRAAGQLGHADLVGFQRLSAEEAALARPVLAPDDEEAAALADLPLDTVLWRVKGRPPRRCEVVGTDWELRVLGPAHR